MKESLRKINIPFWGLVLLSLLVGLIAYQLIVRLFFPAFLSRVCTDGADCNWALLEGFSSLIGLVLLLAGVFFAAREYIRQESQISFQVYEAIHSRITDPAEEAARRWIIINIQPLESSESKDEWLTKTKEKIFASSTGADQAIPEGQHSIKKVLNTLDYFGFVAEHYINVEGPLLEWMSAPIAKVWERIWPYVEVEREKRGEPDYYLSASYIGNKCLEWRNQKGLKSTIIDAGI
jgi:hypothetical protein